MTEVIVFASPGRDKAHERLFASLAASDIGDRYEVMMQGPGVHRNDHWRLTHERAAKARSEFVLVLEDDVIVNRHLLENVESWGWKHHKDFGAGWLYNPGGYSDRDTWYRGVREWAMTPGVLYRTESLERIVELAWTRIAAPQGAIPWDCAVSWAAQAEGGKRLRVHYPSLVEHPNDVPSALGNPMSSVLRTSRGTFDGEWARPIGHEHGYFDRFGRRRSLR